MLRWAPKRRSRPRRTSDINFPPVSANITDRSGCTVEISMTRKNRPGPKGKSCLTCKRRHKKCDQRLPVCVRCERGGFECLGYNHNSDRRGSVCYVPPPHRLTLPEHPVISFSQYESTELVNERRYLEGPSSLGSWSEGAVTATFGGSAAPPFSIHPTADPQPERTQDGGSRLVARSVPKLTDSPMSTLQKLAGLYIQLPSFTMDPLRAFLTNPDFDEYIFSFHDKLMQKWYFKTVDNHKKSFQKWLFSRIQNSTVTFARWVAFIGVGICEAFFKGDVSHSHFHNLWVGHVQGSLKHELLCNPAPTEIQDRRHDWLHLSLLKTMLEPTSHVYQIIRSVTPMFLELVFSTPTLWPNDSKSTYVPMLDVLTSGSHELAYFVLIDCSCAIAFGLPQQVDYDTTIYSRPASPSHQWAHGTPIDFQPVLADINACRDKSPVARDWREIEYSLLTWQSRMSEYTFTESWMTIAWYAVQESWRLALLIYLYLAVCERSSDDPQIRLYVKQLLQVIGTVRKQESSGSEISYLVQYLIAGICADREAHRQVVRDVLLASRQPKFWFLRGAELVPVLDHLWHGAAADGRPVKWSDYMRSREAVLPILL